MSKDSYAEIKQAIMLGAAEIKRLRDENAALRARVERLEAALRAIADIPTIALSTADGANSAVIIANEVLEDDRALDAADDSDS